MPNRRPRVRKRQRGFTLIETLVAFTILALALVTLLQAFSFGLRGTARAEDNLQALLQARSLLAEVGQEIALADGLHQGVTEDGSEWEVAIALQPGSEATSAATGQLGLYDVTVTLRWDDSRSLSLDSQRLGTLP
jgi:general secretion pathway protein I